MRKPSLLALLPFIAATAQTPNPILPRMPKLRLPIGTTLRTRDSKGNTYAYDSAGTIHRISPERPWHGKSERRQVLAGRRLIRNIPAEA